MPEWRPSNHLTTNVKCGTHITRTLSAKHRFTRVRRCLTWVCNVMCTWSVQPGTSLTKAQVHFPKRSTSAPPCSQDIFSQGYDQILAFTPLCMCYLETQWFTGIKFQLFAYLQSYSASASMSSFPESPWIWQLMLLSSEDRPLATSLSKAVIHIHHVGISLPFLWEDNVIRIRHPL